MSEQEEKGQKIYDLLNAKTKPIFYIPYIKQRKLFLQKKTFE